MSLAVMVDHLANLQDECAAVVKMSEAVTARKTLKGGSSDKVEAYCCF